MTLFNFAKYFLIFTTFYLLLLDIVLGQPPKKIKPCEIRLSDFPAIQDLRLGMTLIEIKDKFELSDVPYLPGNGEKTYFSSHRLELKPWTSKLADLTFIDDELYKFQVTYDFGERYETLEAFARAFSKTYDFPVDGWTYRTLNYLDSSGKAEINCYGFLLSIWLHKIDGSEMHSITVEDVNYRSVVQLRRYLSEKEKARKANLERPPKTRVIKRSLPRKAS